ncbi:MAG: glycosyltransferase family 2 protein [Bdellovibrionaceae bacterium]|nr:glycosyltransferase family 2 protein [Pseudobdellovibrionaceae bacterium]
MRVSLIIPTYNRADFLVDAVNSAFAQDYSDLEIIIADNASSDHTSSAAKYFSKDPRIKYFRNPENIGMVKNWRKAVLEYATGEWFLILSDDDILTNTKFISQAIEIIKSSKNVSVVYSNSYVFDEALNTITKIKLPFAQIENGSLVFSKRGTINPQDFALCNVLFNRKSALECDAFMNSNNLSCDTELFLRLCLRGSVGVIQEYSSIYRVHSGNLLKSASRNIDLVMGSLDSLLVPLLEAEKAHMDPDVIRSFVVNSRIKREILVGLLKASALSDNRARKLYFDLKTSSKGLKYKLLPSLFFFNLLTLSAKTLTPFFVLRKLALYLINTSKRFLFGHQIYFELLKQKVYIID